MSFGLFLLIICTVNYCHLEKWISSYRKCAIQDEIFSTEVFFIQRPNAFCLIFVSYGLDTPDDMAVLRKPVGKLQNVVDHLSKKSSNYPESLLCRCVCTMEKPHRKTMSDIDRNNVSRSIAAPRPVGLVELMLLYVLYTYIHI